MPAGIPPRAGYWLIVVIVMGAFLVTGCRSSADQNSNDDAEIADRRLSLLERGATEAVEHTLGSLTAGEWGAAWDTWSHASKIVISRQDYIALNVGCDSPTGYEFSVTDVRITSPTTADVDAQAPTLNIRTTYQLIREAEQWRFAISDAERTMFSRGLEDLQNNNICPFAENSEG